MNSKYVWPASGLTAHEMSLLYQARSRHGWPISELIRQAVLTVFGGEPNEIHFEEEA